MNEDIDIIGGTTVQENIIRSALNRIKPSIKIFIDNDNDTTNDDFYIGNTTSKKTSYNFLYPIRLGELLNAVERKNKKETQNLNLQSIEINEFTLDPKSFLLRHEKQDKEIYLTEKETSLLSYLANAKTEVSREVLLEAVWGYTNDLETHTLETHLYRLRQKLENEFNVKEFIIFGDIGYYLNLSHNAQR